MGLKTRLVYLLKHNATLQLVYERCMSLCFKVLGLFISTDEKMILFVSFMGTKYNDSPKAIYEYIKSHDEYSNYKCIWALEHPDAYPFLNCVKMDSFKYFVTAIKAKYWVTNTNIERGLHFKKKSQVYLNTWHGIALKKIGNDCPGRNDYNFNNLDYFCVSGKYDESVFKSAFNANESSFLKCGMPRNDVLWNPPENIDDELRAKLGIREGKKIILYAPTWRDSTDNGASYAIKPPIDFHKWKSSLGDEYVILFRAHHITTQVLSVEFNDFIIDVSNYDNVNELMIAADILVTDYSAIAFDFSILCKPILCFAYDYDDYIATRGTYFDMKSNYPNEICFDENTLLNRVIDLDYAVECSNTRRFRDRFFDYKSNATKTCVDALFS